MIRNNGPAPTKSSFYSRQMPPLPNKNPSPAGPFQRVHSQSSLLQQQPRQFIKAPARQLSPPKTIDPMMRGSSFLTFPSHLQQQQIQRPAIGLSRQTPVPGPTAQWTPAKATFLGNVVSGSSLGTGISSDLDYLSKGFDLAQMKSTGTVYCPVCETSYSTGALEQHVKRHRQLDEFKCRQLLEQMKESHRQTTKLSRAGLSDQTIRTPIIIQPAQFTVDDKPTIVNNLFVVNSAQRVSIEDRQPQLRAIETVPLQYPISETNFYSCFDGAVNQDTTFTYNDVCGQNECMVYPRQLTNWEVQNLQKN